MKLTDEGLIYALRVKDESIVARVAIAAHVDMANDWPIAFQRSAIAACNAQDVNALGQSG